MTHKIVSIEDARRARSLRRVSTVTPQDSEETEPHGGIYLAALFYIAADLSQIAKIAPRRSAAILQAMSGVVAALTHFDENKPVDPDPMPPFLNFPA